MPLSAAVRALEKGRYEMAIGFLSQAVSKASNAAIIIYGICDRTAAQVGQQVSAAHNMDDMP